jgi:PhnB protein
MVTDVVSSMPTKLTAGNNFLHHPRARKREGSRDGLRALSAGGRVGMPLQKTEWAEKHGNCTDKFGVQWMVDYTGNVQFPGGQA